MCTVTYLPLNNSSFILTHNRDEHHTRTIALLPELTSINGVHLLFPKDEQGGGTWFACSQKFSLCLLNGGFEKHVSVPPYKHSRGKVILDFFDIVDIRSFIASYDFNGIEPFTLIVVDHVSGQIHQIVKDSELVHHALIDHSSPQIWSSTTLYSLGDRNRRKRWFEEWVQSHQGFKQQDIISFHKSKTDTENQEGILVNRNEVLFTVSLTSVLKIDDQLVSMHYEDFLQQKTSILEIP